MEGEMNQLNSTDNSFQTASQPNIPNFIVKAFDTTNQTDYLHTKELHKMEIPEVIIVILIIVLWFLSIKKFAKKFDHIRTTHYREIPYSYRQRALHDATKIRIVKRETDGVVYLPTLPTLSRSYPTEVEETCETTKKKLNSKSPTGSNENMSNIITKMDLVAPMVEQLNASPNKNLRRLSQSRLNQLNLNTASVDLINPLLIPPLVRRSLLDLHQKSIDNLSLQKCSFDTNDNAKKSNTELNKNNNSNKPVDIVESPV